MKLYGHPFSSYTWKARIALLTSRLEHDFIQLGPDQPESHNAFVAGVGPLGRFPVLDDGGKRIFEASCIVEYLAIHHPAARFLLPRDDAAALPVRTLDRVFDLYVMAESQAVVNEYLRAPESPDMQRVDEAKEKLRRIYDWLEQHLPESGQLQDDRPLTLVDCAAAPSLFYADWVEEIGAARPHLAAYRAWLLARREIAFCVDEARPWRPFFPPGAPDRD